MDFSVGQQWTYRTHEDLASSRLVIGAIVSFAGGERIVGVSILGALQSRPDGTVAIANIPFLPMTESALAATVAELDGTGDVDDHFAGQFEAWQADARGLSFFTVPFEGSLDRMIARQMAELVGQRDAAG